MTRTEWTFHHILMIQHKSIIYGAHHEGGLFLAWGLKRLRRIRRNDRYVRTICVVFIVARRVFVAYLLPALTLLGHDFFSRR